MPLCDQCRQFVYRRQRQRRRPDPAIAVHWLCRAAIAKCKACGEEFKWLPESFDMKHRFNRTTHEYCGGSVEMLPQ